MLLTKQELKLTKLEPWAQHAIEVFELRMMDHDHPFPCIPATQGYRLDQFRFGFISNTIQADQLAELLQEYSKSAKDFGDYTSLIIFFKPFYSEKGLSVEEFEYFFWELLSSVAGLDRLPWPSEIPDQPDNPLWEYCFNQERLFMYCATPAHRNRQSRYFPIFMLAVTPRWVLERFYSKTAHHQKIKNKIRERLANYDSVPIHSALNSYGNETNFEWEQYFLRDDDTKLSRCPFHRGKPIENNK